MIRTAGQTKKHSRVCFHGISGPMQRRERSRKRCARLSPRALAGCVCPCQVHLSPTGARRIHGNWRQRFRGTGISRGQPGRKRTLGRLCATTRCNNSSSHNWLPPTTGVLENGDCCAISAYTCADGQCLNDFAHTAIIAFSEKLEFQRPLHCER